MLPTLELNDRTYSQADLIPSSPLALLCLSYTLAHSLQA